MIILLSCINAIAYRLGGASHSDFPFLPKWLVKGYVRIIGVASIFILYILIRYAWHWTAIPSCLLLGLASNSYHGWITRLLGKPSEDNYWFNYLAHGIGICLAILPWVWHYGLWHGFGLRLIVLPLVIMLWSIIWDEVNVEEMGRGFFIVASLPMLFI